MKSAITSAAEAAPHIPPRGLPPQLGANNQLLDAHGTEQPKGVS